MQNEQESDDISFKQLFFPITTQKAIYYIIIIGFVVYFNSLFNGFVIDDAGQIIMNSTIHSLAGIPDLFLRPMESAWIHFYYRPLPLILSAFLYSFFGDNAFFYHLFQLGIHIGNSTLIFLIFKKYLKIELALFLSLVFLVHPINQEAVVYVSALQDTLFLFLSLLSFYILLARSISLRILIISGIFLFLSFLSKETSFIFLLVNNFYLYLFKRTWLIKNILVTITFSAIYVFLRLYAKIPFQKESIIPLMEFSFWERMMNVPAITFYYISTFFYPDDLVATQSWYIRTVSIETFYLPLMLDILFFASFGAIYFLLWKGKQKRIAAVFSILFVLGILLHMQIIPIDATVANRFFYLPIIGLIGIIGFLIDRLKIVTKNKLLAIVIAIFILSAFSVRTVLRNVDWKNQYTLLSSDIKVAKDDAMVEYLYGKVLTKIKKYDEAEHHLKRGIELYPNYWLAWFGLGLNYYEQGNYELSKDAYLHVLAMRSDYVGAYENMALLLLKKKEDPKEIVEFVKSGLKHFPASEKLWNYLIFAEYRAGNHEEAANAAKKYYELKKDNVSYKLYQHVLQGKPIE